MLEAKLVQAITESLAGSVRELQQELDAQGHRNTGALNSSMKVEVIARNGSVLGTVSAFQRLDYVNRRVFQRRVTWAQVRGLTEYFRSKGLSEKEAKSAAWATAKKQVTEGSPTRGSYAYSSNGRRTNAIETVYGDYGQRLVRELGEAVTTFIRSEFVPELNATIASNGR